MVKLCMIIHVSVQFKIIDYTMKIFISHIFIICIIIITEVQWNLVNTTTFGPWKTGRINGVVVHVLKGFFK